MNRLSFNGNKNIFNAAFAAVVPEGGDTALLFSPQEPFEVYTRHRHIMSCGGVHCRTWCVGVFVAVAYFGLQPLSLVMIWYSRSYRGQMEAIKLNFWAEAVLSNFLKLPHTVRLKKSIYAGSRGPDPSWLRSRESHNLESPINPWENPHRESDAYLEIPEHFAV